MINLLPPARQEAYRYARSNRRLLRWFVGCGLGFVGLVIIAGAGMWYLKVQTDSYRQPNQAASSNLATQKLASTNRQATNISNDIKLAVQVLGKEVLFSDLLKQLAAVTPSDAALSSLTISEVKGALDISATAKNYDAATQLQANLTDPGNRIFSKADIVSINCNAQPAAGQPSLAYPCTANIRALFASNNPYLFINVKDAP